MDQALRKLVRGRARHRCEYCGLAQADSPVALHVEHITPRQHGGGDDPANLALACNHCNQHKGPNLTGLLDGKLYPLFNPRKQNWNRHFRWEQTTLVGKTKTGIVTVQVLNMNNASRLMLREFLLFAGRFPPGE